MSYAAKLRDEHRERLIRLRAREASPAPGYGALVFYKPQLDVVAPEPPAVVPVELPPPPPPPAELSVRGIIRVAAAEFGSSPEAIKGPARHMVHVQARHVAMYLVWRLLPPRSCITLGRQFGGRDHTTALHALQRIRRLMVEDVGFALKVEALVVTLTSSLPTGADDGF